MKIQFLEGLSTSAVQLLEGIKAVPLFSVFSGALQVKSIADDKGWHFCSDYPRGHIQY